MIIPLREKFLGGFLNKTREHLTNVAHQLFDGIGKRISLNLMSVCHMERLVHTEDGVLKVKLKSTHTIPSLRVSYQEIKSIRSVMM